MINLMKEAHKLTREIKAEYKDVDYKAQLGICISYLSNNEKKGDIMKEFSFEKGNMVFKFRNLKIYKYNVYLDYKIEGILENSTNEGYYKEAEVYLDRKVIAFSFKYNGKTMKGVNIPDDMLEELKKEIENAKEEQKKKINDIVSKIANGSIKIKFSVIGNDYKRFLPRVENLPKEFDIYENDILISAIKKLGVNDIVSYADNYILARAPKRDIKDGEFLITLSEAINLEKTLDSQKRREEKVQEIFNKAKETGERQELERWTEECNDKNEACDIDIITVYAMPDGTKMTERSHTW